MRVTYVGYGDFHTYAGMKQLYHFAQEVCKDGHEAQILIAGSARSVASMDAPARAEIIQLSFVGPLLARHVRQRVLAFRPDIVHVWTPRHVPALAGWQLGRVTGACTILDHEDDEEYHVRAMRPSPVQGHRLGVRRAMLPLVLLRYSVWHWARPLRSNGSAFRMAQEPLARYLVTQDAEAHTAISPNLVAWARARWPGVPVFLLYPGADLQLFQPAARDLTLQAELGLDGRRIIVYSGAMNLPVFRWFMGVLSGILVRHPRTALVLVGDDHFRAEAEEIAGGLGLRGHYRLVGRLAYSLVPRFLGMADVLVQHPLDLGNELRLPAKLPEYLGMGRAVVTYAQGIGESLEDRVHVRKLYTADPAEATEVICGLLDDPQQRAELGSAARAVASERFDWARNGQRLMAIYQSVLKGRGSVAKGAPEHTG